MIAFRVAKQGLHKYGQLSEWGCPGCKAIKRGYQRPFAHPDKCRQRSMEHILVEDDLDVRAE